MGYFYEPPRHRRGHWFGYIAASLVGMLLGAALLVWVGPELVMHRLGGETGFPRFDFPQAPEWPEEVGLGAPVVYVADTLGPAVVGIVNEAVAGHDVRGRPYLERRTGSGVIISANGYIVTNHHVIADANQLTVLLADGTTQMAEVVGSDPPVDLAVIRIEADGLPHASLGDSDALRVGELAVAIGNPLGMDFKHSVTAGVISGVDRILQVGEEFVRLLQTDAVINPGNSGGPLANHRGEVIGINTLKLDMPAVEGMGFAIPSNTVTRIVEDLINEGRVRRPWMGVTILDRATIDRLRVDVDVEFTLGVLIQDVQSGSPADEAGLRPRDVIIRLGEQRIDDIGELQVVLREHRVDERVEVVVIREDEEVSLEIQLGELVRE